MPSIRSFLTRRSPRQARRSTVESASPIWILAIRIISLCSSFSTGTCRKISSKKTGRTMLTDIAGPRSAIPAMAHWHARHPGRQGDWRGAPLGCAPNAEIVLVRVANSVVLFYNSAIARAFDDVHQLSQDPKTRVFNIITMSMGGLASQAWADAVNALYDQGVFIVTAAGNNYDDLPTRNIVFPARFERVVAACGAMADHTPDADLAPRLMAGNYGPDDTRAMAISASTPNTGTCTYSSRSNR